MVEGSRRAIKESLFSREEKKKHPPSSVKPFPSPFPENPCLCTVSDAFVIIVHACLVVQLCQTLCNPMNCSPLGSSVHGILQARILVIVATII